MGKTKCIPAVKLGAGGVPAIAWFEEIDFDDERCRHPKFWTSKEDVVVALAFEEAYPALPIDAGQLSGARLVVYGSGGQDTGLNVNIGLHMLGLLWGAWLRELLGRILSVHSDDTQELVIRLPDFYPRSGPVHYGGGELRFLGGQVPEMRILVGEHCFGVARGPSLIEFLRRVQARASRGVRADNIICMVEGRRGETPKQDLPVAG